MKKNNSLMEDILETAFKSPIAGGAFSIFLAGLGLYLTNKGAPEGAKPAAIAFLSVYQMLGKFSYIASVVVLVITGIGYLVTSAKRKKQATYFGTRKTLEDIKSLSWKEFEEFVGSLFQKMGYEVEVTGGLDDGGIDLVVKKDGKTSFVQCKKYQTSKVSLSMVRDFYGAMSANLNFDAGYFITTGIFTLEARHFADDKPIELIDGAKLMDYVSLTSQPSGAQTVKPAYSEKRNLPQGEKAVIAVKTPKPPVCPRCRINMVLRTAKNEGNEGAQFWGCPNFPKCRATKLLSVTQRSVL